MQIQKNFAIIKNVAVKSFHCSFLLDQGLRELSISLHIVSPHPSKRKKDKASLETRTLEQSQVPQQVAYLKATYLEIIKL